MRAFELLPNTKKPAAPWLDSATWAPVETFGNARYGLPCGPENGFFAIDLDNKDGNTGAQSFSNWLEQQQISICRLHERFALRETAGIFISLGQREFTSETGRAYSPAWMFEAPGGTCVLEATILSAIRAPLPARQRLSYGSCGRPLASRRATPRRR
jgi:hypothetical protein